MPHPVLWAWRLCTLRAWVGLCDERWAPTFHFSCSRNVVSHPTRQSRKEGTWVLLWGPCTKAAPACFGNLVSKADRPSRASVV